MNNKKPWVIFTKYSPYMVTDLENFRNSKGEKLHIESVMSLCRCGESNNKPYCDGSHAVIGVVGEKDQDKTRQDKTRQDKTRQDRTPDKFKDYMGKDITINDNRSVCSHDGTCTRELPNVFNGKKKPWMEPVCWCPELLYRKQTVSGP